MRQVALAVALVALLGLAGPASALNDNTSLVMHAVVTSFGPCAIADPCPNASTQVAPGDAYAAYLVVRNYDEVAGVQTAFDWGGNTFTFGLWDCQSNQVNGITPSGAGGPQAGTIASAFDCISGGASEVVGRMQMIATGQCLTQVTSSFPFGSHVVSCTGTVEEIPDFCWGSICTGSAGINACEPCPHSPTPVEDTTWGAIKGQYN